MIYNWSDEKNELLKKERDILFEEIILCISNNKVVDILEHPNKRKYPNQNMYLIDYNDYMYVVPFVIDELKDEYFLKTIFPSREYTKLYLSIKGEENEKQ